MSEESHPNQAAEVATEDGSENAIADESKTPRFRWELGLAIVILGIFAELFVVNRYSEGRDIRFGGTYQVFFSVYVVLPSTILLLGIWWLLLSGLRWSTRLIGTAVAVVLVGSLLAMFRFEGFEGDMIPRWTWRLESSGDERLQEFLTNLSSASNGNGADTANETDVASPPSNQPLNVNDGDWPNFRGTNWDSTTNQTKLSRDWPSSPPELVWKHPSGVGWSSFAVVDGLVFTQEQRKEDEVTVCYDLNTGNQIWSHEEEIRFIESLGGDGPRSTPTVYDSRIYTLGATGILQCLEARTGERVWSADILEDADALNLQWAMAGSPLIVNDWVIVNPGGIEGSSIAAYHRLTGKKVWSSGDSAASYSTAQIADIAGTQTIVIYDGDGVTGYALADGKKLWAFPWTNQPKINAAMPFIDGNKILAGTGYATGSIRFEVRNDGDEWVTTTLWTSRFMRPKFNDFLVKDGFVFGLDEGIMACIDLETGKRQWKRGRYGYGQLLLSNDLIIVLSDKGELVLLETNSKQHKELGQIEAVEGKTWAHPALVRDLILIKSELETACYRLPLAEH